MYVHDSDFEKFIKLAFENEYQPENVMLKTPEETTKLIDAKFMHDESMKRSIIDYILRKYGIHVKIPKVSSDDLVQEENLFCIDNVPYIVIVDKPISHIMDINHMTIGTLEEQYFELVEAHRINMLSRFRLTRHKKKDLFMPYVDVWKFSKGNNKYHVEPSRGNLNGFPDEMAYLITPL